MKEYTCIEDIDAKRILDFLLRKAGCDMMIDDATFYVMHVLSVRKCKTQSFRILYYVNSRMIENIEFSREPTWKEVLDKLLEISAEGLDIISRACDDNIFLKKGTTLEQILVEMDMSL